MSFACSFVIASLTCFCTWVRTPGARRKSPYRVRRIATYASTTEPTTPRPLSFKYALFVQRHRKRKKMTLRSLDQSVSLGRHLRLLRWTHKSMFSESSCVLEPPLLAAKLLRRLTGILELPGIVISRQLKLLNSVMDVVTSKCWRRGDLHFLSELGLGGSGDSGNHMPLCLFRERSGSRQQAASHVALAPFERKRRNNLLPFMYSFVVSMLQQDSFCSCGIRTININNLFH
jgi:hypothetical protein